MLPFPGQCKSRGALRLLSVYSKIFFPGFKDYSSADIETRLVK